MEEKMEQLEPGKGAKCGLCRSAKYRRMRPQGEGAWVCEKCLPKMIAIVLATAEEVKKEG